MKRLVVAFHALSAGILILGGFVPRCDSAPSAATARSVRGKPAATVSAPAGKPAANVAAPARTSVEPGPWLPNSTLLARVDSRTITIHDFNEAFFDSDPQFR